MSEETKNTPAAEENTAQESEQHELPEVPVNDSEKRIAELEEQVTQLNDKYLRLYSEFDNFRRRTAKERVELLNTAGEEIIKSLLPAVDNFERAIRTNETATDVKAVNEGITLIAQMLKNTLQQKGLVAINSIGEPFNTDLHEAITEIPAPTPDMKGKVVDEVEKGYTLNGKVIRFAKVVVGS
ncbi:MAG TPA: nucleotide exchange factor GrpE [Bacteroidia bacterium]|nr:nucleotide exchange factor GrpE [Bacteroidia bacterium]